MLLYIYVVTWNANLPSEDTKHNYHVHGHYVDSLTGGGLAIPGDSTVQRIMYCFVFFIALEDV